MDSFNSLSPSFFTPVIYVKEERSTGLFEQFASSLYEIGEELFDWGEKKVYVISQRRCENSLPALYVEKESKTTAQKMRNTALKLAACASIVLPLFFLATKFVLRWGQTYHQAEEAEGLCFQAEQKAALKGTARQELKKALAKFPKKDLVQRLKLFQKIQEGQSAERTKAIALKCAKLGTEQVLALAKLKNPKFEDLKHVLDKSRSISPKLPKELFQDFSQFLDQKDLAKLALAGAISQEDQEFSVLMKCKGSFSPKNARIKSLKEFDQFLLKHGKHLKSLDFFGCPFAFNKDEFASTLQKCPNLEALSLLHCSFIDEQYLESLKQVTKLRCLNLDSCCNVLDFSWIEGLALEELDLSSCDQLGKKDLQDISKLEKLKKINLSYCSQIVDSDLAAIAGHSLLEELCLTSCSGLSDAVFESISSLLRLKKLELSACQEITDDGILSIKELKDLKCLELSYCSQITKDVLEAYKETHPELKISGNFDDGD